MPANRKPSRKNDRSAKPEQSNGVRLITVDSEHAGQRVDNFLLTLLKGVPRTMIYRIIRKGEVRINKGRVRPTTRLGEGDVVRVPPVRQANKVTTPVAAAKYRFLNDLVLFEDDALLVLDKPAGMAVHAGSGIRVGVIEALRALRTDLKYLELVHRLDRETSGCLVLAKKSAVLKALHLDFKQNSLKNARLDKRYLALVKGRWQGGQRRITRALDTQARRAGERVVVVSEDGSYASSIFRPVASAAEASLLEVKLLTGRTHQVRVHAQSEQHPLAGDTKYGDRSFNATMRKLGLQRLFLHAASLGFYHPQSGEKMTITAPLPAELDTIVTALGLQSTSKKHS